jgi:periplasmic divalent cation tolerance protein
MSSARIALTTSASREEAERIAHTLIEERLAACVNVIDGIRSIYRWHDAVESAGELLLLIKTDQRHIEQLRERLTDLHSYELPEFLVLEVAGGSSAYLDWIAAGLR